LSFATDHSPLEFESTFASCIGQSLNATVERETATIKNYTANAFFLGALGCKTTNGCGTFLIRGHGFIAAKSGVQSRSGSKRVTGNVVDELHV
jgi:hypothetical protein